MPSSITIHPDLQTELKLLTAVGTAHPDPQALCKHYKALHNPTQPSATSDTDRAVKTILQAQHETLAGTCLDSWTHRLDLFVHGSRSLLDIAQTALDKEDQKMGWINAACTDNDTQLYQCTAAGEAIDCGSEAFVFYKKRLEKTHPIAPDMMAILLCIQALQTYQPGTLQWTNCLTQAIKLASDNFVESFYAAVLKKEVGCLPDHIDTKLLIEGMMRTLEASTTKQQDSEKLAGVLQSSLAESEYNIVDHSEPADAQASNPQTAASRAAKLLKSARSRLGLFEENPGAKNASEDCEKGFRPS